MKKYLMVVFAFVVFFIMKNNVMADVIGQWKLLRNSSTSDMCGPYIYMDGNLDDVQWGSGHGAVYLGISVVNNTSSSITSVDMSDLSVKQYFGYLVDSDNNTVNVDYNSCPKYIGTNRNEQYEGGYKFMSSNDKSNLKDYKYIFTYIESNKFTTCKYNTVVANPTFLNFYVDGDKKFLLPSASITGNLSTQKGISIDYKQIAEAWSKEDKIVKDKKCPETCYSDSDALKSIVTDSFTLEMNHSSSSTKKCVSASENSDDSIVVCYAYSLYFDDLESFYNQASSCDKSKDEYCKVPYLLSADKQISEISDLCTQIFKVQNYNDSCVKKCLDFSDELKALKDKYGIKHTSSDCGLSARIIKFIANIFKWVKYIAPVLAIILGILDFIKAISSQSDDEMKKAQGKFVKRLIAAALLFIVPFGIEFILDKFNVAGDNPFCNLI